MGGDRAKGSEISRGLSATSLPGRSRSPGDASSTSAGGRPAVAPTSPTLTRCRAFLAPDAPDLDAIERLSAQDAIAQVTAALSEEQAEVVLLRVLAGLDAATVGDILGRTENWVWVTQHRVLRKLATRLGSKLDVRP